MWVRVSRSFACPACGRPDWCSVSEDGEVVKCMRVPSDTSNVDKTGATYYIHRQGDSPIAIPGEFRRVDRGADRRADPGTLDRVYRLLFNKLSLRAPHRADLMRRGLSAEQIKLRGYVSWPPFDRRRRLCEELMEALGGVDLTTVPGFFINKFNAMALGGGPACFAIPCRTPTGDIVGVQLRNDDSTAEEGPKYLFLSSFRHGGPSSGYLTHVPIHEGSKEEVRVTEGFLKADVATARGQLQVLAMANCSSHQGLKTIVAALGVKRVLLAMDSDHRTNRLVALGMANTALALRLLRVDVAIEDWDGAAGKGIDDVLVSGAPRRVHNGQAAWELLWRNCNALAGSVPYELSTIVFPSRKTG